MKTLIGLLIDLPARLAAYFSWAPPLAARITVGWVFLWSGWGKLNDLPHITANFIDWGITFPHVLTPFVSLVEFLGGLLLLLGLFTRLAAAPLIVIMIVAIIAAKRSEIDSIETLLGFDEVAYMVLFLWLAVAGPGPLSFDWLLQCLVSREPGARPLPAGKPAA